MIRSALIALIGIAAASASAKEPWQRTWVEVRSPHFVVVSAVSTKQSVDLTLDLERFRTAVQMVTNIGKFDERIPTKVYMLPYADAKLGFKGGIKGYFRPDMRANYAVVIPAPGKGIGQSLKHEYVHFLVHNRDHLSYPVWFDEGFAEVVSTLAVTENRIDYGRPDGIRVDWLSSEFVWMPFDELLATRNVYGLNDVAVSLFYAQSWLLVHHLMFGRSGRDFAADTTTFLRRVESGEATTQAFEQAFGMPVASLRETLIKYIRGDLRSMTLKNQNIPDAPIAVAPVTADSIASQLALLLLKMGNVSEAKRYWDAVIALNPNNAEALVGLGDCLKLSGRFDEAPPFYEKAIALEPQNPYPELDYAEYFLDRANAVKDTPEAANYLVEARHHFARSYKIDPNVPETLAMNGTTYLFAGQSPEKGLESLKVAHAMLPSQPYIKLKLAEAYAMSHQPEKAIPIFRSLIAWGGVETSAAAEKALKQLSSESADSGANPDSGPVN